MSPSTIPIEEKQELELIRASRNGDRDAMAELFRRHYHGSIMVARRILPAYDDCLDAVQSAYLSAFKNFSSFRGESSFKTWIRRIVLNSCFRRLRDPGRRYAAASLSDATYASRAELRSGSPSPEEVALRAELRSAIAEAAANLPKPLSEVFACCISGLSVRDTAEALGLTVQATKTRLFRARARVRQDLQTVFCGNATVARSRAVAV
jgi:RNA polymerase sigma-70 factor (ECF subfamily)